MDAEKNHKGEKLKPKSRKLSTGLKIVAFLLIVLMAVSVFALARGQMIAVRTYSVSSRAQGKVKIAALTDLHGKVRGKNQERIASTIKAQDPDIIVYLGDMVERTKVNESKESIRVLTEQLIQIAPVYYVDGNHEQDVRDDDPESYENINDVLADIGAVQLDNSTVRLSVGEEGTILNLCGISTHYYWSDTEYELLDNLKKSDGIKVILCHYPETVLWREVFKEGGCELALCGHTHGGLVRVPFRGGLISPEWGWWPPYDLGEYPVYTDTGYSHYGGETGAAYLGTMIISGGLAGEHGIPRINNPMEISIVEIGK